MPDVNVSTRHFAANLWLKTAFQLTARRYLTATEKHVEVERCLLRVKELARAELEECLRMEP